MALTRTNIIGRITLPDDTNPVNSVVRFIMTGFDTDATENATIIQIPIDAAIDALGDIDVDLWPNPLGVRTTFYSTYARIPDGNTNDVINVYLGQIEVPSTGGPYDLNDLLPIAPPAGADVADYIAQLAAAVASAEAAAESTALDLLQSAANAVIASDAAASAVISSDLAATYAGIPDGNRATSVAGLPDPTTLALGDDGYVSGSGDDNIDGVYEVQDSGGNVWVRTGDTGLASKATILSVNNLAYETSTTPEGDVLPLTTPTVTLSGGAVALGTHGITIPLGQTGNSSLIRPRLAVDYAANVGQVIRIAVLAETSATFTRNFTPSLQVRDLALVTATRAADYSTSVSGTQTLHFFDYTIQGDEGEIRPSFFFSENGATGVEESFELKELKVYSFTSPVFGQTKAETNEATLTTSITSGLSGTLGDQRNAAGFRYLPSNANGATSVGYVTTIPAGQTGDNSILYGYFDIPGVGWTGRTIETVQTFETSATFNRAPDKVKVLVGLIAGGSVFRDADLTSTIDVAGTTITITSSYVVQSDELRLIWGPQLNSGGAAVGDETIKLTGWKARFTETVGAKTALAQNTDARIAANFDAPAVMRYALGSKNGTHQEKIVVALSGGDFTDPVSAIAQANALEPSARNRILVEIGPGDFDYTTELQPGNFVDIHGLGSIGPTRSLLRFFQDDAATTAQIDDDSAVRLQFNTSLRGLAIHAKNARYAIHPEVPLSGAIDRPVWVIENCDVRHFAKTSLNGVRSANTRNAIGSGTGDGYTFIVSDNTLWSETGTGFAWHNNVDHIEPTLVVVENNRIYGGGGTALAAVSYGSGQADLFKYKGNSITGSVGVAILGAGDVRETRVIASANTPHATKSTGTYLPEVTDEERILSNTSGTAIGAGDILAFDGSADAVRLMTSADAANLFAGVALEAIADGDFGRVKISGWMHIDHISTAEVSLAFNATMSVGATAGTVEAGGAQGILRAVKFDTVLVGVL